MMRCELSKHDRSSVGYRLKQSLFTVAVTTAFVLGLHSLLLASGNAGGAAPATYAGMVRTATTADAEMIELALGELADFDLVYVILDSSEGGAGMDVEIAARRAAQAYAASGMSAAVRLLDPLDSDFTMTVAQNGVDSFPAVLVVNKAGGIVLVTDGISEESLRNAYMTVWGTASSCEDASSEIY
jgi:hypothetical protein